MYAENWLSEERVVTENCEVEMEKEVKKPMENEEVKEEQKLEEQDVPEEQEATAEEQGEEETQEEKDDYKEKFYYLAAEFENARKRFEREREKFVKYGNEKILKSLLEVVDNLDRTLNSIKDDEDEKVKNIANGIAMVQEQFLKVLMDNGLEKIESLGKDFDPNYHEAMAQQPVEGKKENEIVQVYQDGYMLNGRLLRAAKVIIAK